MKYNFIDLFLIITNFFHNIIIKLQEYYIASLLGQNIFALQTNIFHSWPNTLGISLGITFTSDGLLSSESSSLVSLLICPSAICCIQVLGLQVAVAIGQDRDPFGRLILGLLVSIGSTSKTTGVVVATEVDTSGTSVSSLSQTSVETPIGCLVELFLFLSSTVAKIVVLMLLPLLFSLL